MLDTALHNRSPWPTLLTPSQEGSRETTESVALFTQGPTGRSRAEKTSQALSLSILSLSGQVADEQPWHKDLEAPQALCLHLVFSYSIVSDSL